MILYFNKGNEAYDREDFKSAVDWYSKCIDVCPNDTAVWGLQGFAYAQRGLAYAQMLDYPNAIKDFTQSIELDPTNAEVRYNRGNTKLYAFDNEGAIEDFNKTIEIALNVGLEDNYFCALTYNARGIAKFRACLHFPQFVERRFPSPE
jgi:tetratricopeptide (TPR) repeat protein